MGEWPFVEYSGYKKVENPCFKCSFKYLNSESWFTHPNVVPNFFLLQNAETCFTKC